MIHRNIEKLALSGRYLKKHLGSSVFFHALFLVSLIFLHNASVEHIEELKEEKLKEIEEEKEKKVDEALAEEILKEDIEEILEEILEEEDEDIIEELVEDLMEELEDKEEWIEEIVEEMNSDKDQEKEEEYLERLTEEIIENLEESLGEIRDDQLENELLEELVYEDLPHIDNEIDNALKKDSLEGLSLKALNEKAREMQKQVDAEVRMISLQSHDWNGLSSEMRSIQKEVSQEVHKMEENRIREDVVEATKHATKILKMAEVTGEKLEGLEWVKKEGDTFQKLRKNIESVRKSEQKLNKSRQERAARSDSALALAEKKLREGGGQSKQNEGKKESSKNSKSSPTQGHKNQTNSAQSTARKLTLAKATLLKQGDKKGSEELKRAVASLEEAKRSEKKQSSSHKSEVAELKRGIGRALSQQNTKLSRLKRNLSPSQKKTLESSGAKKSLQQAEVFSKSSQLSDLEKSVSELENSQKQMEKATGQMKSKAKNGKLAEHREKRESFKKLIGELKALSKRELSDNREAVVKALRDNAIERSIGDKSDFLRENLHAGTEADKESRTKGFKEKAREAVAGAQAGEGEEGDSTPSGEEGAGEESEGEGQGESGSESEKGGELGLAAKESQHGLGLKGYGLGENLVSALSQVLNIPKKGQSQSESSQNQSTSSSDNKGGAKHSKSGVGQKSKVSSAIQKVLAYRAKRFKRNLSAEEKREVLSSNINVDVPKAPPKLKFARPTASGKVDEPSKLSAEVYIGKIDKKAKAKTNKNRDRKRHPAFKKGSYAAIPYMRKTPVIDGESDEWDLEKSQIRPNQKVYMSWRAKGLYLYASIRDKSPRFESATAEIMLSNFWEFDTWEIWFDMKNSKAERTTSNDCQQFFFWPALRGVRSRPELREVMWGSPGHSLMHRLRLRDDGSKKLIASKEHSDHRGYDIEIYLPRALLRNLEYFKAGQVLGFLYNFDFSSDYRHEIGSLDNYKKGYQYSSSPKTWGNLQLLGTDAELYTLSTSGKKSDYAFVEVSQPLSLEVNDPDSNTDASTKNYVTVRVRNLFGFNGKKVDASGKKLGDWEDLRLRETGKNTGIFKGKIATTLMFSKEGDGKLGVQPGDTVRVSYNDFVQLAGEYDKEIYKDVYVTSPMLLVEGVKNKK